MNIHNSRKNLTLPIVLTTLAILISIPISIALLNQQQDTRQRAFTSGEMVDRCGRIKVTVAENPSCPVLATAQNGQVVESHAGAKNNVTTYTSAVTVENIADDGEDHVIKYRALSYFCSEPFGTIPVNNPNQILCLQNEQVEEKEITVSPNHPTVISITRATPNAQSCGTIQEDLEIIEIDGDPNCTLTIDHDDSHGPTLGWGMCQTGTTCNFHPSETPTPTPSICPVPDTVKNVRIDCPFCNQ